MGKFIKTFFGFLCAMLGPFCQGIPFILQFRIAVAYTLSSGLVILLVLGSIANGASTMVLQVFCFSYLGKESTVGKVPTLPLVLWSSTSTLEYL